MGTASSKKFLKHDNGRPAEEAAIVDTAGAADADRIPATNPDGYLDPSLLNATDESSGAADAGKIVQLDAAGKLAESMMPAGLGADVAVILTSEALSANDLVNVWNDGGTAKARKADAAADGKEAMGFVKAAFGAGVNATVYFEGTIAGLTGLTPGRAFLSDSVPGTAQAAVPVGAGKVAQIVGFALSATELNFEPNEAILLA